MVKNVSNFLFFPLNLLIYLVFPFTMEKFSYSSLLYLPLFLQIWVALHHNMKVLLLLHFLNTLTKFIIFIYSNRNLYYILLNPVAFLDSHSFDFLEYVILLTISIGKYFLIALLKGNWHTKNCTYLMHSVWWVWTVQTPVKPSPQLR